MDPLTVLAAAKGVHAAFRQLAPYVRAALGEDTDALAKLLQEGDRAWLDDVAEQLRRLEEAAARAAGSNGAHAKRAADQDEQIARLLVMFRFEAARDASKDRRHLLACVTAKLFFMDVSIEDLAQVERTVRSLDGRDIRSLAFLATLREASRGPIAFGTWNASPRKSVLLSAGCVDIDYGPLAGAGGGGKPELTVSALGVLILQAAELYLQTPAEPTP